MTRKFFIPVILIGLTGVILAAAWRRETAVTDEALVAGPTETAVFAGGCFWGLQAAFDKLPGVVRTRVGYTGGSWSNPTYEQVVSGQTGHAEAVEVVFDPSQASFADLTRYFLANHRSGRDEPEDTYRTRAYRSAIFVGNDDQRELARSIVDEAAASNGSAKPVATLIENASTFWEAEAYHQKYLSQCAN